jgi:sulfur carrier protein
MNTLTIHFNGEARAVPAGSTLQEALALLLTVPLPDDAPIATAVNGIHVARAQRGRTMLAAGDEITTFEPITGG